MAALYADENFDAGVTAELRRFGHDIRTVQEVGRCGFGDATVLADATADGRAVLTFNRRDFIRLHLRSAVHAGIVACTSDGDVVALAARIDAALAVAGPMAGRCLRVTKPPPAGPAPVGSPGP